MLKPKRYETYYSKVAGEPFPDPKGRWRMGGGINVPVEFTRRTSRTRATEIKHALKQKGLQVQVSASDKSYCVRKDTDDRADDKLVL